MPADLARLWFGTDEPPPSVVSLVAGALTADLVEGNLRAIRWQGIEVLRAVAYVVRDRDWGTFVPTLGDLVVRTDEMGFAVRYESRYQGEGGAVLHARASIQGCPDGALVFTVDATPDADFETNRCGFCVLHPIVGLAGSPITVEHVDGAVVSACLPNVIEPWQPFKNLRALTHAVAPGLTATCRMEGDTFEMEDQRNWSDASYKTYVRPLALLWPYRLPAGIAQRQSVTLTLGRDRMVRPAGAAPQETTIILGEAFGVMPRFGLVITPEEADVVQARRDKLAAVGAQTLMLHVRRLRPDAEAVLECVLPGSDDPRQELERTATLVREAGLHLDVLLVSPSVDRQSTPPGSAWPESPPLEAVYAAARASFPDVRLGGGMFSYFPELNRKRPPVARLDCVTHCTCPIVHAADDLSVMQSLEALPFIVRSARAIIGATPYRIGPSTIGMRQNPYGSRTYDNPGQGRLTMTHADPRQRGLFAAAWMIGYAAATEEAGLDVFTGGALTGAFGLMPDDAHEGEVYPVFHAACGLAAMAGDPRLACRSSRPDRVLGIAAERNGQLQLWLANITEAPQTVGVPAAFRRVAALDHTTWAAASRGAEPATVPLRDGRLSLEPYAIARLES